MKFWLDVVHRVIGRQSKFYLGSQFLALDKSVDVCGVGDDAVFLFSAFRFSENFRPIRRQMTTLRFQCCCRTSPLRTKAKSVIPFEDDMNAVSPFGVVLRVLLVENLGYDGQCPIIVMHDSIENDLGKFATLAPYRPSLSVSRRFLAAARRVEAFFPASFSRSCADSAVKAMLSQTKFSNFSCRHV